MQQHFKCSRNVPTLVQQKNFKCKAEYGVKVKNNKGSNMMLICLYVDDLVVTSSSIDDIEEFKGQMMREYDMTIMGKLAYFLGMEFIDTSEGFVMHQKKYSTDILKSQTL